MRIAIYVKKRMLGIRVCQSTITGMNGKPTVCVAGTFDGLHAGHEALLARAFAENSPVLIGVTSDVYVRTYKNKRVRSFDIRVRGLTSWLEKRGFAARTTIIPISDPFEPAATDPHITTLIVSTDSQKRGEALNALRVSRGLNPLTLIVVPMVTAEDKRPISASRVAAGVIDRKGKLLMPDYLRTELAKPLGRVLSGRDISASFERYKNGVIITVGDCTAQTILAGGITPRILIVDNKVNRKDFYELQPTFAQRNFIKVRVVSGPGYIGHEAIHAIREALIGTRTGVVIEVEGEEDLLAIPAIIEAPVGATIYYGQPNTPDSRVSGIVEVPVTRAIQQAAKALLAQFVT